MAIATVHEVEMGVCYTDEKGAELYIQGEQCTGDWYIESTELSGGYDVLAGDVVVFYDENGTVLVRATIDEGEYDAAAEQLLALAHQ